MRIWAAIYLGATAMLFASTANSHNEIDTGPVALLEIADGVYAVEPRFAGANGAVIINGNGVTVVDSHGSPASARAVIRAVEQITDRPIRYVINTHWHVDHHSGNAAYRAEFGADVSFVAHLETRESIVTLGAEQFEGTAQYRSFPTQQADEYLQQSHPAPVAEAVTRFRDEHAAYQEKNEYAPVVSDLSFTKELRIHGTTHEIVVMFLGKAHTSSDAIVYLPDSKVLVVGDVLTQPILWTWSSYPESYVQVLRQLEELDVEKIVIGHGGPVIEGKAYLALAREFFEAVLAAVSTHSRNGLSVEAALEQILGDGSVQGFRDRLPETPSEQMFTQMVTWTVARAYETQAAGSEGRA